MQRSPVQKSGAFVKVPKPVPTGNPDVDEKAMGLWNTKFALISALIEQDEHVLPLWNKYQERIRNSNALADASSDQCFSKQHATLHKLIDEESEWIVTWLSDRASMVPAYFLKVAQTDPESLVSGW